jgi:16S rRNA (adenine1518-N6/adenine1519-N6)-dimethyltransferase
LGVVGGGDYLLALMVIPKKRFGQNFLRDQKVVADFVAACDLTKEDVVMEIGAGTGILTKELAEGAGRVFAFEIDRDLIPVQRSRPLNYRNVKIINQDFLKIDNQKLSNYLALHKNLSLRSRTLHFSLRSKSSAEVLVEFKLVGSIPYQITSPLIHKLLTFDPRPSLVVLLIQKEVAEKICARPPKATYLSNIVQLLGEVKIVCLVPKTAFWPVPEVGGAIVKLVPNARCPVPTAEIERFQRFLHSGFQNPRKMLRRKFDPGVLKKVGIDPTQRAQCLDLERWVVLYNTLGSSTI